MKKIILIIILLFTAFCSKTEQPADIQPETFAAAPPPPATVFGVPTDQTIVDAVMSLLGIFIAIGIVFGVKRAIEMFVESYLIMWSLKRQGKIAEGLDIIYNGWHGTVVEISGNRIKLQLKDKKNFVIIHPKEMQHASIEVVVD